MKYEPVIGLEVHAQLLTDIKNLLRLFDTVRPRTQRQHLPSLLRLSWRTAGAQ